MIRSASLAILMLFLVFKVAPARAENVCHDLHPMWSPEKNMIVFYRQCGQSSDIYLVDPGSRKLTRLTEDGNSYLPVWSERGASIVFRRRASDSDELALLDLAEGSVTILRAKLDATTLGAMTYSDAPKSIIFVDKHENRKRILRVDLASGAETILLENLDFTGNVSWSEEGLLFDYNETGKNSIGIVRRNTDWHKVFDSGFSSYYPQWNAAGNQVAFISNRDGNPDVYIHDRGGNKQRLLYGSAAFDGEATFSPDGKQLVFVSVIDGRATLMRYEIGSGSVEPLLK